MDAAVSSEMKQQRRRRLDSALTAVILLLSCCCCAEAECPEAIFAFGASMSDTGNFQAAFPFQSAAQYLPYGETFFGRPANRFSNGRVVVDFFALALEIPLLSPHLQSVQGYDFTHGANFAFGGVTAQNNSYPSAVSPPFYFWIQTKQFQFFKERTVAIWNTAHQGGVLRSSLKLTKPKYFKSGLYFTTFGTNDFVVPLLRLGQTIEQVQANISSIANAMVANTAELYKQGARTLMVFNVPPLGCYPVYLASLRIRNMSTLDARGCLTTLNAAVAETNSLILSGLRGLREKYPQAAFIYADLYAVLQTLISNGPSYGFKETFRVCCGAGGGEYNLQAGVSCGARAVVNGTLVQAKSCSDPGSHIHWDGLHITDAAARFVATAFLQGEHVEPSYNLSELCKLNFEQFN